MQRSWQGKLKTPEGETKKYRNHMKQTKDTNGVSLTYERKTKERRKEYLNSLLNEENRRKHQDDGILYPGLTSSVE